MAEDTLLDALNESQREAVTYNDGPSLVIAGAGSGKTRVLTHKIAYLLRQGIPSYRILALTFTNKAAREMKERIVQLVGAESASQLWMGTFHSIASRILRREAEIIDFPSNFTIYDEDDSQKLIKVIIKEKGMDEKVYIPKEIAAIISRAKERLVTPSVYQNDAKTAEYNRMTCKPMIGDIYATYQSRLRASASMDFDDLLLNLYLLFRDNPKVCYNYANRFRYVFVDEYQDTNYAQYVIVSQLASVHKNLCVVGDDAQSIYSFRGANIENILRFQEQFPGARLFKLGQNYRSTKMIVGAAASVIAKNHGQIPKEVYSMGETGEPVSILSTFNDRIEAAEVVRRIETLHNQGYDYSSFAILYRTNRQSRIFEESLRSEDIPYKIYGGRSFYQRKEIKDVIAYCRLAVNPNDEEALRRIINTPARGIGNTTQEKLGVAAIEHNVSLWQAIVDELVEVNQGTKTKLQNFAAIIKQMGENTKQDAASLMESIVNLSGLWDVIKVVCDPDDKTRRENVEELLRGARLFVKMRLEEGEPATMADYLQEISLLSNTDEEDDTIIDHVTLMTIHSAKGLEFPVVFVVGMEEELFPASHAIDSPRAMEEERRLFYVAVTRAKTLCYLTYADSRFVFTDSKITRPSRFLDEIDQRFLQNGVGRKTAMPKPRPAVQAPTPQRFVRATHATPTPASADVPAVGSLVEHARFGMGTVEQVTGEGLDVKVTVRFDNMGVKQLLLRFASLKICQ